MSEPFVDVVIACHDLDRPIERAVRSVLQDDDVRDEVRVTVVAHGLRAEPFETRLAGIDGAWRVVAFADGIRSPAGPYNHGLSLADGEYCAVLGSDDFLEPGTMRRWIRHVRAVRPSAVIAGIRLQGQPAMPNPLVRLGRSTKLDAAKDRLFYRTAPLGLVERAEIDRLGLRMTEGVRVGEDFDFGIRLWSLGRRIDFLSGAPGYVIGVDAAERTTHAPLAIEESFEPIVRLLDAGLPGELSRSHRKALAIKLVRISIVGHAQQRDEPSKWRGDDEVEALAGVLRRLVDLAPGVLAPFNIHDRRMLDALLDEPTVVGIVRAVRRSKRSGRFERWVTVNPLYSLSRESMLRRYLLYFFKRERKAATS